MPLRPVPLCFLYQREIFGRMNRHKVYSMSCIGKHKSGYELVNSTTVYKQAYKLLQAPFEGVPFARQSLVNSTTLRPRERIVSARKFCCTTYRSHSCWILLQPSYVGAPIMLARSRTFQTFHTSTSPGSRAPHGGSRASPRLPAAPGC